MSSNNPSLPHSTDGRLGGRAYAFLIAIISALGGFLFGYDLAVMTGANQYLKDWFGLPELSWSYALMNVSALVGCILGPFLGAWLCDRYGRRKTLLIACFLLAAGTLLTSFPGELTGLLYRMVGRAAPDSHSAAVLAVFIAFRVVGGIGVGLCSIASPMYTNEIAPARWRGSLGFMYQLAIVVGMLVAVCIAWWLAIVVVPGPECWRWMFASAMIFVIMFYVLLLIVPESPRWLAEQGRTAEAERVFARIDGPEFARVELEQVEKSLAGESGTFAELFAPGMRKALFIGMCLALFNNLTGWSTMGGYLTLIFERSGYTRSHALMQNAAAYAFMGVTTLLACLVVDRIGRRPLWVLFAAVMIATNAFVGVVFHTDCRGIIVLVAVCLCAIPHSFALGPLPWLMMSEIFPTRIRARAVAITTTFIWVVGFAAGFLFPIIAKVSERLIGSIAGVFWMSSAVCVLAVLFGLTLLPETKGRTLEEIGESWTK